MGSGKRLGYYLEKQGIKLPEFCKKNSLNYNSFVQILVETRPFGIKMIDQVHNALPNLNIHWMLYDEGPEEVTGFEVNEPIEKYITSGDTFEHLLLKYLSNEKIKKKIYEVVHEQEH